MCKCGWNSSGILFWSLHQSYPTRSGNLSNEEKELKKAEEKFNRLHNRFYTALSILHDATAELPQKGNTPEECQKVSLICAINDLEEKLNGVCIEDFINK